MEHSRWSYDLVWFQYLFSASLCKHPLPIFGLWITCTHWCLLGPPLLTVSLSSCRPRMHFRGLMSAVDSPTSPFPSEAWTPLERLCTASSCTTLYRWVAWVPYAYRLSQNWLSQNPYKHAQTKFLCKFNFAIQEGKRLACIMYGSVSPLTNRMSVCSKSNSGYRPICKQVGWFVNRPPVKKTQPDW